MYNFNSMFNPETTSEKIAEAINHLKKVSTWTRENQVKSLNGDNAINKLMSAVAYTEELIQIITGEAQPVRILKVDSCKVERVFGYAEHVGTIVATDAESLRQLADKLYKLACMCKGAE